ncbi:ParB/RepB/Spo0J family partition protein [Bifidobacterium tibiigranuli]|jgi:ParB family chromosome partitioning protein|uniref:ParB/RepB/Spo0J family partition protein n=1 Tax=Bifidobacterium tibiigranuli TaxID=2172043 RepID=UPI0023562A02|nr:ParB/RepB/Spo0J family partition protein [Bifidobacterium tibiigranuli]MCH3973501.1 ParB/RepB/Spo0J family partition protein [Bifidobacterium tibiigranuli]MCI2184848.1 ParB/RepB/Spo0J family partition protein [Bifidobacterium tibiigranuli]MCI2204361.1 ParB/RepB/Spo0J family partition protein [Bifidobacterium tibiigranuli]
MDSQTLQDISIESIDPNPANPRQDVGDVSELAASIAEQGVQQNLVVVPSGENRYTVVIGHRRLAAARQAGLASLPCAIREWDETTQREIMLVENTQRTDLTALEEGDGYQGLLDLGVSVEQAAQRTGRSEKTVRRRLSIAAIPQAARDKAATAQPTIEQWQAIAELDDQSDLQEQLAATAGTRDWDYTLSTTTEHAARRRWYEAAKTLLDQQQREYTSEEPNGGYYQTPEGCTQLALLAPGKPFEQQEAEWLEARDEGAQPVTRIGMRAWDGKRPTWSEGIALYAQYDIKQVKQERAEREAARQRQREQAEAEQAPAKAHAATSLALRREFIAHLLELKTLPRNTSKGIALLAATAIQGLITGRIDAWGRDSGEILQTLEDIGLQDPRNDDENDTDEGEYEGTGAIIARTIARLDPQRQTLALAYASIESSISWLDWLQDDGLTQSITPLYAALETLGYQTSQPEQDGLDGAYLPEPEPDEENEEEQPDEDEAETATQEENEEDETETGKEPEESEAIEQ